MEGKQIPYPIPSRMDGWPARSMPLAHVVQDFYMAILFANKCLLIVFILTIFSVPEGTLPHVGPHTSQSLAIVPDIAVIWMERW